MLRRLHSVQPDSFEFTHKNLEWIETQLLKYPSGRQASAVIPLLWRAQEQEGWLSRPAIECVAVLLKMAPIRVFEVASFYFMFQLKPVGEVAHIQVCGTTPCMLCDSEDLISICKEKISPEPHTLSQDGKLSWEEVECLGACSNAPVAQIGKDYYEDLSSQSFSELIKELTAGRVPRVGSQIGRFASEPKENLTSLKGKIQNECNASVAQSLALGDTIKRIV
jgi:NADH-quinone oxidoreductase subunit E